MTSNTTLITPDFDGIPAPLRCLNQWVTFTTAPKPNGKLDKIPHSPRTGRKASTTNANTWESFDRAEAAYRRRRGGAWDGISFVLTDHDPYTIVDLDGCRDPETGAIEPWAMSVIEAFDSYTEPSVTGTGVHIVVIGELPEGGRKKGRVEMYSTARHMTFTGRPLPGYTAIRDCNGTLEKLHAELIGTKPQPAPMATPRPELTLDDHEVLRKAHAADNGDLFAALFDHGDLTAPRTGDGSQNSADLALCNLLRFWTGADPHQMDRLFRRSALMRDKWDAKRGELTYGEKTIATALPGSTYAPGSEVVTLPPEPGESAQGETDDPRAELARLREVAAVQAARIARLEAERAADAQVRAVNREIRRVVTSEAHPAKKVSMILVALEVHSNRTENLLSVEGMAKAYHVGEDSLRAARDAYAERGVIDVTPVYYSCSPFTGEVHSPPLPYSRVVPIRASPAETIAALVDDLPDAWKPPAEKPPKREKVQPEAPDETPICPVDGEAETTTIRRSVDVTSCSPCGMPLAAVIDGVILTLPPEPTHPAQGDPALLGVAKGDLCPDSGGSGEGPPPRWRKEIPDGYGECLRCGGLTHPSRSVCLRCEPHADLVTRTLS